MPKQKTAAVPERVAPMLCKLVKEVPVLKDYLFEVKWDGYRMIAYVQDGNVRMESRSGLDYTARYPEIEKALKSLQRNVIIDGEVVVFNKAGRPDFDALQHYNGNHTPIRYCVFDLLWLDGQNLEQRPLTERKTLLKKLVSKRPVFRYSESFDDGAVLYEQMRSLDLEGVIAKRKESVYREGMRGAEWLKIPTRKRQEFVIGGWAESARARCFKSLLFGAYDHGMFIWIGRSGGGYKEKEMPGILKKLKALEISDPPFMNPVLDAKGAVLHYVRPELVANFEFAAWTKTGRIRKPAIFLGFRNDKRPEDVVRELPESAGTIQQELKKAETDRSKRIAGMGY
ncbi:non-homologous end-joining DNA ligase [Niabella drilacis]|uniref:DNA ligase (ATP) n=1 Tax=Niabella drilacis (strain DSM 25811 / CCM 8410 / CCUG 62505 / LMG 26954 / E90) TaxID=1285928 RepID=A0A1G6RES3_NIADE|nr:non-homologous end-joining DNA ligase [Niabella drilacis]SDD03142.1 DNA ligase D [Niabella drilacis]